jgi:hypothetical protein
MKRERVSAMPNQRDQERIGAVPAGRIMPGTFWRRYGGSLVLVLALALALPGCGDDDSDLTGTWTGTVQDNLAGTGTILFTFTQTDSRLSGTWQITFADPGNNNGGTLSGTVSDPSITMVLSPSQPQACSFTVAAERDDDDENHFTGTYAAFNCASPQSGSLDVNRQ